MKADMTAVPWIHRRGRSSWSEISFRTFITEQPYSCEMLKEDLEAAGIEIHEIHQEKNENSCEFSCVFMEKSFSAGIEENRNGSRIIFEADLLLLRNVLNALGVSAAECY